MNRLTTPVVVLLMGMAAPAMAAVEGGFERTLTVTGAVTLSATSGSGGIDITTGADGSVRVKGIIHGNSWGASSDEIAPSSCRPPWFETTMPAAPWAQASSASSPVTRPLTTTGTFHLSRSSAT